MQANTIMHRALTATPAGQEQYLRIADEVDVAGFDGRVRYWCEALFQVHTNEQVWEIVGELLDLAARAKNRTAIVRWATSGPIGRWMPDSAWDRIKRLRPDWQWHEHDEPDGEEI